jgi:hypothetical protein
MDRSRNCLNNILILCIVYVMTPPLIRTLWPLMNGRRSRGAARSEAWVCGRSLAGIAGSHCVGDMDMCVVLVEVSATGRSLVKGSPTECVCVCVCVLKRDQMQQ